MKFQGKVLSWLCFFVLLLSFSAGAKPLGGRIIVVDPGHGGSDQGGVGPTGLQEKDINLSVALFLQELLEEDGATVFMTRREDVELSLQERVDFAFEHRPDLFVSVHHNIMPTDPGESFIEVYHSVRDRGQGRVFGRFLFEELVKKTGVPGKTMGPGNYYLLNRLLDFPAVLGEAYYLSHPASEEALRDPQVRLQEAEAYRAAINKYFALGVPTITTAVEEGALVSHLNLEAILRPDKEKVDPESIVVTLNGEKVPHSFNELTGQLSVTGLDPRPSGLYNYRIEMANTLGGSAALERALTLSHPAAAVEWSVEPELFPADPEGIVQVTVKLFDQWGFPLLPGRTARIFLEGGQPESQTVVVQKEGGRFNFSPIKNREQAFLLLEIDNLKSTQSVPYQIFGERALLSGQISGNGAARKEALVNGQPVNAWGFYYLLIPLGETTVTVEAPGFYPEKFKVQAQPNRWLIRDISLQEVAQGVFHGKVIVLDAAPRYAFNQLTAYLEFAGAQVYQTAGAEEERIATIRDLKPDLVFSFAEGEPFLGHFPRSAVGAQLGRTLAQYLQEIYGEEITVGETRERVILRAPGDALLVQVDDKSRLEGAEAGYTWFIGLWKLLGGQGSAPARPDLN